MITVITVMSTLNKVGHALGRFHEFQRPDRDDFLTLSAAAALEAPPMSSSEFHSMGFPFDIGSVLMYCSSCITGSEDPFDMTTKAGISWGVMERMTTLDALKTEQFYCEDNSNRPVNGYKPKVTCATSDVLNVALPVFTERLCDNVKDCPNGEDEGTMYQCVQEKTESGCCKGFDLFSKISWRLRFQTSQIQVITP